MTRPEDATITVRHLVVAHKVADVLVQLDDRPHRVGHHPSYGWSCISCGTTTCPAIGAAQAVVADMGATP